MLTNYTILQALLVSKNNCLRSFVILEVQDKSNFSHFPLFILVHNNLF